MIFPGDSAFGDWTIESGTRTVESGFQRLRADLLADLLERKNREIADLKTDNEFLKLRVRLMELRIERLLKDWKNLPGDSHGT